VAEARRAGQPVVGEPVASGLALHEGLLLHANFSLAAQYVMSPPLRAAHHQEAVKQVRGVRGCLWWSCCALTSSKEGGGRQARVLAAWFVMRAAHHQEAVMQVRDVASLYLP